MTNPQIVARLLPEEKQMFGEYAAKFELKASELAKLLVARERVQKQLRKFAASHPEKLAEYQRRKLGSNSPTVTAHLSSPEQIAEFDKYAHECGLSRARASAWLLEREMEERWLEGAISDS